MQTRAYREEHVLLVLIDGARVRHRVGVFDDRDRFTYEDRGGLNRFASFCR